MFFSMYSSSSPEKLITHNSLARLSRVPSKPCPHIQVSLLTVHKQPTASNLLLVPSRQLLPGTLLQATEDKLRLERPLQRNVPDLAGLLVRERVVVLVHGGGVLAPVGELVGVLRELGLQGLDGGGVLVEEDLEREGCVSRVALSCAVLLLVMWLVAGRCLLFRSRRGSLQCGCQCAPTEPRERWPSGCRARRPRTCRARP
jgi:hypothetical protein